VRKDGLWYVSDSEENSELANVLMAGLYNVMTTWRRRGLPRRTVPQEK
jgi:hypothetical protein